MLPVRLGVVTAVAALCLWGLFSLLDSLKEPGLLRSAKAVAVKGCDAPDADTVQQCRELFCQKALLDTKAVPLRTQFQIGRNDSAEEGAWIVAGHGTATGSDAPMFFVCEGAGQKVTAARLISRDEFDDL